MAHVNGDNTAICHPKVTFTSTYPEAKMLGNNPGRASCSSRLTSTNFDATAKVTYDLGKSQRNSSRNGSKCTVMFI